MLSGKEKATLIMELSGVQSSPIVLNLIKLLDILIQEIRIDNDTALDTAITKNQGAIGAYSQLKDYILRGLPSTNRQS